MTVRLSGLRVHGALGSNFYTSITGIGSDLAGLGFEGLLAGSGVYGMYGVHYNQGTLRVERTSHGPPSRVHGFSSSSPRFQKRSSPKKWLWEFSNIRST